MEYHKDKIKYIVNSKHWNTFLLILFLVSFALVELSPLSARRVSSYNNGYGTFDMKLYHATTVYQIISIMGVKGIAQYKRYLGADFLFIIAFGMFQVSMLKRCYSWITNRRVGNMIWMTAVLRGVADFFENIFLWILLTCYPMRLEVIALFAVISTRIKFVFVGISMLLLMIGLISSVVLKDKVKILL